MVKLTSLFIFTLILTLLLSGCAWFRGSQKINMAPFSDNASTLFGEAAKISRPFKWKHLKPYTNIPEFKRLRIQGEPILRALGGIVYYSHQVVAINNSSLKDKDKNKQLAVYLSDVMQKATEEGRLDSLGLDRQSLRQVLDNIPKAETYLDAISEAEPIVNSVVLFVQNRLDDLQVDIQAVIIALDQIIEKEFAGKRTNFMRLKASQERAMYSVTVVYNIMTGQQDVLDTLLQLDKSLNKFFPSAPTYNTNQLETAEQYLLDRLKNINLMIQQLSNDAADYHAKQDEMENWRINVDERIKVARNAMTVWAQSHRNLGAGIPVPPLIDVSGFASGLVGTAVNKVVP